MHSIYVVRGLIESEWNDRRDWPVCAFGCPDEADQFAAALQDNVRGSVEAFQSWLKDESRPIPPTPGKVHLKVDELNKKLLDKNFSVDYCEPQYIHYDVECVKFRDYL